MTEKRYYEAIRKWLEQRGYFCGDGMIGPDTGKEHYYQDRGSSMRVDVAGVKNLGTRQADSIEVACVEVKDSASVRFSDVAQAYGYTAVANRVYLANRADLDTYWERFLSRIGLGYLQVQGIKEPVTEKVPSAYFKPDEASNLEFLRSLWIVKCAYCGVYFPIGVTWKGESKQLHEAQTKGPDSYPQS